MTAPTSSFPTPVADLVDDFHKWSAELDGTPSARATMRRFRIGTDKAKALLSTLTDAPAELSATVAEPVTDAAPDAPPAPVAPVVSVLPQVPDGPITALDEPLYRVDVEAPPKIGPVAAEPIPVVAPPRTERVAAERTQAHEVAAKLDAQRALLSAQRGDLLARKALEAEHRIAMDDVREQARAAERARRDRARDAVEADALGALYRRAQRSGTRARLRSQIQQSAEMRALRVARVRSATLAAGIPLLMAFAAWSTTGVQAGVVRLLDLESGSAGWWAAWAMEPALIAIVGLIIIGRAMLRSAGGNTDGSATAIEWAALSTSLVLNMIGAGDPTASSAEQFGSMLAHCVGPIGCATVAFLIGLFDGYVAKARPDQGAPRLVDMNLDLASITRSRD
ncbi:hypothetical protein Cme02nite_20790 [Catellatospora methionotrophica]|uniref:DUF2637 domain-containing protein n=1 Tax=Catellatospora methionotrophica TaxID=121620 RepID=A0A8J3L7M6_9ACTN|nr:hypothetical protein [Catellatospora methionotrophica]GIG13747.1 hypothetical protein Cme02nite_20790 [Catellatospora methionotrophica]